MIDVAHVSYTIGSTPLLRDVSLQVQPGEFVGILGPNGSGKSTLLKTIYKVLWPADGEILVNGQSVLSMSNRELARKVAVVAQESEAAFDYTVQEVVLMARYPSKKLTDAYGPDDLRIVAESLDTVGLSHLASRGYLSLSGGEKQRVQVARAFAQQTPVMILDEPTNHLDIGSQIKTLQLLKASGKTILAALHDLSIAARFCDRIYLLHHGTVVDSGLPGQVLTGERIRQLYDIDAEPFQYKGQLYVRFL